MREMPEQRAKFIHGTCPSCHTLTYYTLLGIQHWPEAVAKRLGVPTQQAMYQCECCKTSVMQDSIIIEDIASPA